MTKNNLVKIVLRFRQLRTRWPRNKKKTPQFSKRLKLIDSWKDDEITGTVQTSWCNPPWIRREARSNDRVSSSWCKRREFGASAGASSASGHEMVESRYSGWLGWGSCERPPGTYLLLKVVSLRHISDIYMTHKVLTLRQISKILTDLTFHKVPKIWTSLKSHGNFQYRLFLSIPSRITFKTFMLHCLLPPKHQLRTTYHGNRHLTISSRDLDTYS